MSSRGLELPRGLGLGGAQLGQVRRRLQLGLLATVVLERVVVALLHDAPRRRARRRDGVREPAPRDEEALVGVHVAAVGEAEAGGPQLRHLVVHALGVGEEALRLGLVAGGGVLGRHHLGHVDGAERPLGRPDRVLGERAVGRHDVGVAHAGERLVVLVVAGVLLGRLPHVVRRAGAELLVEAAAQHRHAPRLAVHGEAADVRHAHGEVAAGVDVAALGDDALVVGQVAGGRQHRVGVEPLVETLARLRRGRHRPQQRRVARRVAGVVLEDGLEGEQGGVGGEVVLIGHVLALGLVRGVDLGAPRAVVQRAELGLQRRDGGQHGDGQLHGRRRRVVRLPVARLLGDAEVVAARRVGHVVVGLEAECLQRAEDGGPHVLAGDGLPVVEVDDAERVPLGAVVGVGPGVLPRVVVRARQGVHHGVLGAHHAVEEGAGAHGDGVGGLAVLLLGEVRHVAGVRDLLERGAADLLRAVLEVVRVGADVDDAAGVAVLGAGRARRGRVQGVALIDVRDVVQVPQRQGDLPRRGVVQVEAVARERALLDGDLAVELRCVAVLVEGADAEVRARGPVRHAVGQDIVVRAGDAVALAEHGQQPLHTVGVGARGVGHVGVRGVLLERLGVGAAAEEAVRALVLVVLGEALVLEVGVVAHVVLVVVLQDAVHVVGHLRRGGDGRGDEEARDEHCADEVETHGLVLVLGW
eukprot:PhM_4_TR6332/c1_g2_i1/m.52509